MGCLAVDSEVVNGGIGIRVHLDCIGNVAVNGCTFSENVPYLWMVRC